MRLPEFLIFEYAIHGYVPMDCLLAENIVEMFNCPAHGLPRPQLVSLLYRLFSEGDLEAGLWTKDHNHLTDWPLRSERDIEAALNNHLPLSYGLTPRGGARWEIAAQADWSRFVNIQAVALPHRMAAFSALSMEAIEVALVMAGLDRNLFFDLRTAVWDEIQPWKATYWKIVPSAHRLRIQADDRPWPHGLFAEVWPCYAAHLCSEYQSGRWRQWYSRVE